MYVSGILLSGLGRAVAALKRSQWVVAEFLYLQYTVYLAYICCYKEARFGGRLGHIMAQTQNIDELDQSFVSNFVPFLRPYHRIYSIEVCTYLQQDIKLKFCVHSSSHIAFLGWHTMEAFVSPSQQCGSL